MEEVDGREASGLSCDGNTHAGVPLSHRLQGAIGRGRRVPNGLVIHINTTLHPHHGGECSKEKAEQVYWGSSSSLENHINTGFNTHQLTRSFFPYGVVLLFLPPPRRQDEASSISPHPNLLLPGPLLCCSQISPTHSCWVRPTAPAGTPSQPGQIPLYPQAQQKLLPYVPGLTPPSGLCWHFLVHFASAATQSCLPFSIRGSFSTVPVRVQ